MSKGVRVSALAKELNMTSKEVVALCKELSIGATSASSNMVDAQAERVRRSAVERGLKREAPPVKLQKASTAAIGRVVPRPPRYRVNWWREKFIKAPETNEDMEYEDDISDDNPVGGSPPPNDITPPNQPPHTPDNSKSPEDDEGNNLVKWWKEYRQSVYLLVVRCLHLLPIASLWVLLETSKAISTDNVLEWWSFFLIVHIILGAVISWFEQSGIRKKLNKWMKNEKSSQDDSDDDSDLDNDSGSGSDSDSDELGDDERRYEDVEGSQSFLLIVVSIHGIAAVAGATISYFMIASFFNQDLQSYIFLNNEGAIAAITLIVVVASAAVVAVYVELAKSVRQQIDTYEVEISTLNQVLVEINDYAEQVWRHFDSVARTTLEEWKKVEPTILTEGRKSDLERPLNLAASLQEFEGRKFQDIDDRELWRYDDLEQDDLKKLEVGAPSQHLSESYSEVRELEHSRLRYRHSMNLDNSSDPPMLKPLKEEDQRRRARRLRYLGWNQHGLSGVIEVLNISNEWNRSHKLLVFAARRIEKNPNDLVPVGDKSRAFLKWLVESGLLHIDETEGGQGHSGTDEYLLKAAVAGTRKVTASGFKTALLDRLEDESFKTEFKKLYFRANEAIDENSYNTWRKRFEEEPATPSNDYHTFLPAHEKSLTYVMRELAKKETALNAGTFIDYAIRDFDRRVWNGHLNRTVSLEAKRVEGGLVATLNKLCAQLDLDPSVFIDDLEVFIHLRGLVWFAPEITDTTTMNKSESLNDRERMALYRYAAYSRFVYYAFWLVEGPARFKSFEGASSRENMEKLKAWIDDHKTTKTATNDATTEFLLLMLADQRSALFNWLRSVRACTVRKSLFDYETELENEQKGPNRHFGIEIIPARHMRLTELQKYLRVSDQAQMPIRLRSVYDLVPRQSHSAKPKTERTSSDRRYIDTYRFISISSSWEDNVTISAETMRGVFAWLDNRTEILTVNLEDKPRKYFEWLVRRVFPANAEQPGGRPDLPPTLGNDDAQLLVQALWLVSPTFKAKFQREPVPSIGDASEVEQYRAVLRQISTYCLSAGNADDMKNTFFGGANPATHERATAEYEEWLVKFRERAIGGAEDN